MPRTWKIFAEARTPRTISGSPAPVRPAVVYSAMATSANERTCFCQMRKSGKFAPRVGANFASCGTISRTM